MLMSCLIQLIQTCTCMLIDACLEFNEIELQFYEGYWYVDFKGHTDW